MNSVEFLGLLLALFVQAGGMVWWAATVNASVKASLSDIAAVKTEVGELKTALKKHEAHDAAAFTKLGELSARLDERSGKLADTLSKVAAKLGAV